MLLAAGGALLAALWAGPLPGLVPGSFTAHMLLHVGVVAGAAPLLALGLAGGRLDPVRRWPRWFAAVPASVLELLVVWGWHAPSLQRATRTAPAVLAVEQLSFLAVGLLLWLSAFGGAPARRAERRAAGVAGLLLTSMHMTLLGTLLALGTRRLYHPAAAEGLADQHVGGAIMLVAGGAVYLGGGLALVRSLLAAPRPGDGAGAGGPSVAERTAAGRSVPGASVATGERVP